MSEQHVDTTPAAAPAATPAPTPAPSPAPAAPASSEPGNAADMSPDALAAFNFDPFAPSSDSSPGDQSTLDQPTAQPGSEQAPPVPPAEPATQNPAAPAEQQPGDTNVPDLTAAIQELRDSIASSRQPQPGQPGAGNQPDNDPVPAYDFELPDQLLLAMNSENPDERKRATATLIKGVAQGIHRTAVNQVRSEFMRVIPNLFQQFMQAHVQRERISGDFYGKYPHLNKPALKPIVQQVANQLQEQKKFTDWNESARDMVARAVHEVLGVPMPGQTPAAPAVPGTPAQPAAPVIVGGSASRAPMAPQPAVPAQQQEMLDLLN